MSQDTEDSKPSLRHKSSRRTTAISRLRNLAKIILRTYIPFLPKGVGRAIPPGFADTITLQKSGTTGLRMAVVGDFGKDSPELHKLCAVMASRHAKKPYNLLVSVGDTIYITSRSASLTGYLVKCFSSLLADNVLIYNALGNEDAYPRWRRFVLSEPLLNMKGRRYYRVSVDRPRIDFFFLDSNILHKHAPDRAAQVQWLKDELAASTASWKIVVMHHAMYSSDLQRGQGGGRIKLLEPIFRQYGVDIVLNGHNHMYERFEPIHGIRYIQCGGASWPNNLPAPTVRRSAMINTEDATYLELTIDDTEATFCAVNQDGREFDSGTWIKGELPLARVEQL